MPRKIRELKAELRRAGFVERPAKGSHTFWEHSDARPMFESRFPAMTEPMPRTIRRRKSDRRWRDCEQRRSSDHERNQTPYPLFDDPRVGPS
jgi:hypothetical protein